MSEVYYDDRSWLVRNRRRLVFLALLLVGLLAWRIFVVRNDDGIIAGQVLGPDGAPAAGAQVELQEETINLLKPPVVETTDAEGRFRYENVQMIEFVIRARKDGVGVSGQRRYHLYFKGQNFRVDEPLILSPDQ